MRPLLKFSDFVILFLVFVLVVIARAKKSEENWELEIKKGSLKNLKWWEILEAYKTKISDDEMESLKPWFTNRQWRQFRGFQTTGKRSSNRISPNLVKAALSGLRRALYECYFQFKQERWNCKITSKEMGGRLFGKLLLKSVPETAFLHSIVSAGVTQAVAESCLTQVSNCPCNNRGRPTPDKDWQWEGCDHNVHFARRFSRRLLDTNSKNWDVRPMVNMHNNEAGRKHVLSMLQTFCTCHGTSGSCTLKTCNRRIPPMRIIGKAIKKRYTEAIRVVRDTTMPQPWEIKVKRRQSIKSMKRRRRLRRFNLQRRLRSLLRSGGAGFVPLRPSSHDLVYSETSAKDAYCQANADLSLPGTTGRTCNSTSTSSDNCVPLCCQRGFMTRHYYAIEKCDCQFVWCCSVKCRQCLKLKARETCL